MKNIINLIEEEIVENYADLEKLAKLDKKFNFNNFNIDKIHNIFNEYKDKSITNPKKKTIGIIYFGDYEFTLGFILYSIINNIELTLFIQDFQYSVNEGILNIINQVLKEKKMNKIRFFNMLSWEGIRKEAENIDKMICFGDTNSYNILKNLSVSNLKLFNYNIGIYINGNEFQELKEKIISVSYNTCIEIRNIDDINRLQKDKFYKVVILSKDEKEITFIRNEIDDVIINDNPFKYLGKDFVLVRKVFE